ncbi:hypothetical protein PACTADRAFT_76891 [Pachysolen tannophilus NRRL Y-2460]|uniref:Folylpolyglutamate synthase n=1 Tax=Pachysolen tannophilus NRRL Y-2460 TaxID=669874 RepID=A0A1E4TRB6_PACTA|nr:hypothetical protein PACTADRAFT_76891 [Pachysolen tannophilus NRRL Y-2460]
MRLRTYSDAVKALNTLQSNFATVEAIRKSGNRKNVKTLLEMYEWTRRMGYKEEEFDKLNIIHVTGTKGKGSTCSFVESIISQYKDGKRISKIGLYTSPHLKSVRERIVINGKSISEELFTKYFFEVWDRLSTTESDLNEFPELGTGVKPLYFKYLTLLSFHIFMKEGVNTAIYEVGVGGELDSTNIIHCPTACGISSLGIDHTFMLGNTIEEIAWNKAGIFKKGTSAFTVPQVPEAIKVIIDRAKEKEVKSFQIIEPRSDLKEIKLGIPGIFQIGNASLACALASAHLTKLGFENVDISTTLPAEFIKGLEETTLMGRCQLIKEGDNINWYIDGAHTKESVKVSANWFKSVSKRNKRVLMFNQQTRDYETLIKILYNNVYPDITFDHVIFTTNVTWSSGDYSADLVSMNTNKDSVDKLEVQKNLAEIWNELDKNSRKHIFHDIQTSVNFTRSLEGPIDVFVCGSLHLVGGFLVVLDGDNKLQA